MGKQQLKKEQQDIGAQVNRAVSQAIDFAISRTGMSIGQKEQIRKIFYDNDMADGILRLSTTADMLSVQTYLNLGRISPEVADSLGKSFVNKLNALLPEDVRRNLRFETRAYERDELPEYVRSNTPASKDDVFLMIKIEKVTPQKKPPVNVA